MSNRYSIFRAKLVGMVGSSVGFCLIGLKFGGDAGNQVPMWEAQSPTDTPCSGPSWWAWWAPPLWVLV